MPYSDRDYKVTNINYLNKDFTNLKSTLVEYAKAYFPNSYRDFNETSPGMMLIEMAAYVGDVLSFYIDQQYKEMLLPLAEERRNLINISNMLGYKVKPISPAYVNLTISQVVGTTGDINNLQPDWGSSTRISKGTQIQSSVDSSVIFETLDIIDYRISGSNVSHEVNSTDDNGIVSDFKLKAKVRAISGETKEKTFTVGTPQKFLKLTLSETNVIDIIDVRDTQGNQWFEVDYLAQDHVPIETYYTASNSDVFSDIDQSIRTVNGNTTAYSTFDATELVDIPVPYSLQYHRTSKKFITEINDDDTTSLVFGNGLLRNGQINQSNFLQTEQVGITIPGETQDFTATLDPLLDNDNRSTLGETPAHTTLTVRYRVGGGIGANSPAEDLSAFVNSIANTTVTNETPAFGGSAGKTLEEIRQSAKAFFATQNRCVTQEDYEARVLAMPAKFGNIAKVFADRKNVAASHLELGFATDFRNSLKSALDVVGNDDGEFNATDLVSISQLLTGVSDVHISAERAQTLVDVLQDGLITSIEDYTIPENLELGTIDVNILSYNDKKELSTIDDVNSSMHPIKDNLRRYLGQYRLLTDEVTIISGKIINFGVAFDVVGHRSMNKSDIKIKCINTIREYFNIDKMQFRQPLYTSDLEYELMGIDGVRSVNYVELTQDFTSMHNTSIGIAGEDVLWYFDSDNPTGNNNVGNSNYGWKYDFKSFYDNVIGTSGIILPSVEPAVFELKRPNENIRGRVQ